MVNRLLGMIYLLMNKGTVKASELAERFEVSDRTIYRDVETLSMAGIPIYAKKGRNGGISLTEQFVLDKMLVTKEEQKQILAAMESLIETGAEPESETLSKLKDFFRIQSQSWVAIDFSDWSGYRKELFETLRHAILDRRLLEFDYYGQYGEMSRRTAEPVQLLFKDYTWYLRAFCREREAMRMFKVLRMKRVNVLEQRFEKVSRHWEDTGEAPALPPMQEALTEITVRIKASEAYRVYDHFEEDEISVIENGDFIVNTKQKLDDWIYGKFLSYGVAAEILSPDSVRQEMVRKTEELYKMYHKDMDQLME